MIRCANIAILTGLCALLLACSNGAEPERPVATIRARTVEPNPLGGPRARHSATLLGDGTVLVAGGVTDEGVPLASAELYVSPVAGFESLPSLEHSRYRHTATRLLDGRVLLAGGYDENGEARSPAELYLPDSREFVSAGEMNAPRGEHTATLLADGRVLLLGGRDADGVGEAVTDAEVFDPEAETFAKLVMGPSHPAARNVAVTLADSKVLVLWSDSGLREVFNPGTDVFEQVPPMLLMPPADIGQIVSASRLGDDSLVFFGADGFWRTGPRGSCQAGQEYCEGQCVDQHFDGGNCGSCGTTCGPEQQCVADQCVCEPPFMACGAECLPAFDTADHCGSCLNACQQGEFCASGTCTCAGGMCGSECIVENDPQNCGACGIVCGPEQVCDVVMCASQCTAFGHAACDGRCVDVLNDLQNCGDCGEVCTMQCIDGVCQPECAPGEQVCPSNGQLACVRTDTDANCGHCGANCGPPKGACWAGICLDIPAPTDLDTVPAVITRSADVVWLTKNSLAAGISEDNVTAWEQGVLASPLATPSNEETFAGPGHTTTALPDGSILSIGGVGTPAATRFQTAWYVEELSISTGGAWVDMVRIATALLPNGHTLYALGSEATTTGLFDFNGSALELRATLNNGGTPLVVVPQPTGRALVVGGNNFMPGAPAIPALADPIAHLADLATGTAQELDITLTVSGRAMAVPGGGALIAGRSGLNLIQPLGDDHFQLKELAVDLACDRPVLTRLPNGRVLVAGATALYELDLKTFEISPSVTTIQPRCLAPVVVLSDGKVLLIEGGQTSGFGTASTTWELYDSKDRTTKLVPNASSSNLGRPPLEQRTLNWFDGPLLATFLSDPRQLDWPRKQLEAAPVTTSSVQPMSSSNVSLAADGSILTQTGRQPLPEFWMKRWTMGVPKPMASFQFPSAPVLRINEEVDLDATFPAVAFPGHAPEGSSGSTASSSTALPVPVWFPTDGPPAMGMLRRSGSQTVLRVPQTSFPGLGLMFLATNGKLTGIGPAFIGAGANGLPCRDGGGCESGYCMDGVCCNEPCDGTCQACSTASGAAENGVCGPATAGTRDEACEIAPVSTCGQAGTCDGQGSCALYPDGTECVPGVLCTGGECVDKQDESTCNENDEIMSPDGEVIRKCDPGYRCRNGRCLEKCSSNRDCSGGFACTAGGLCEPPLDEIRVVSCGCRLPHPARPNIENWLAGLLVFAAALRRRRFPSQNHEGLQQ